MVKKHFFRLICCFVLGLSASAQDVQLLPPIAGETLSGHKIILPEAAGGKAAILIFGFTKASKNQTSAWGNALSKELAGQRDLDFYQLPVLEDVPRFVRGMVISSIRKGVPENQRDHFVVVLQGELELKKVVNYKELDDAYLVVLDREGRIVQQTHGAVSDENMSSVKSAISALRNPVK